MKTKAHGSGRPRGGPACRLKNCSYRKKIRIAFLGISLIPLILLGSFCFIETKNLLTGQAQSGLVSSLRQASLSVNSQLEAYNQVNSALCFDSALATAANMEYETYYSMFEQLRYTIDDKFVTARNLKSGIEEITLYTGSNLPRHGRTVAPISAAEALPWYPMMKNSVSVRWYSDEDGLLCIQPILNTQIPRPLENLVVIQIEPEAVLGAALELTGQDTGVLITGDDGTEIYHSAPFSNAPDTSLLLEALAESGPSGTGKETPLFHARLDGRSFTLASAPLEGAGWQMMLYVPDSLLGRQAVLISLTVAVMILFCFLLVYLLSRSFSHRMVYRIEALRENMKTVADGRLEVHVKEDSGDEIGEMTRDFGRMVEQIDLLIQENYASELKRKQAELKALQAQINPHFLYNSLSLINWRALRIHADDISEMAQLLSSFYRTTLNKGKNLITVADELLNVRSYTGIQLIMHSGSFDVEYRSDEALLHCCMPNLMLQPLVENAILHGIEAKENGRGHLLITCGRQEEDILFTVEDNGVGIPGDDLTALLRNDSKGYGLKNVHERARILFGEPYGLTIESAPGRGTCVRLLIPARTPENHPGETGSS